MSEEKIPYGEIICEAVDTIVSKRIENLGYDITTTGIIADDTYKAQGKYTVSNNSVKFEAYSTITTLEVGDSVLVNIPKGDYNNQKTILNKVISSTEDSTYLTYTSPLENMLKFTNNIATVTKGSLLANSGIDNNRDKKKLFTISDWSNYQGFTVMGVTADFETYLSGYDTIKGNYGLSFEFSIGADKSHVLELGIDDMNGNPYHFNIPIEQQKLFDISGLNSISSLTVYLYQDNNFVDGDGDFIPSETEGNALIGTSAVPFSDNIILSNLNIVLGYEIGSFSGDNLTILMDKSNDTAYGTTYGYSALSSSNLKRHLKLRWIHQIDDTTYHITNLEDDKDKVDIKWFHYSVGASTNSIIAEYTGPNWEQITTEKYDFSTVVTLDAGKATERYKVMCQYYENNSQSKYYLSDEIVFTNTGVVTDVATVNAISGLSIRCQDGTAGNYYLYSAGGELINEGQGQGYTRQAQLMYNGQDIGMSSLRDNIKQIKWTVPVKRTMIEWQKPTNGTIENPDDGDYASWTVTNNITAGYQLSYSIKNVWIQTNSLNEISCEVTDVNDIVYKTSWIFFFGVSGSSGSNHTVIISYGDGSGSIPFNSSYRIDTEKFLVAQVYDQNNNEITDIQEGEISWGVIGGIGEENVITLSGAAVAGQPTRYKINSGQVIEAEALKWNCQIIKATYTKNSISATGYLPLSFRNDNTSVTGYDGPRKVIYNSLGSPTYNSNACQLRNNANKISASWNLNAKTNLLKLVNSNALQAENTYAQEETPYACLYAYDGSTILWSQAIFVLQTAYDFAVTNNWNGNLQLDESTGSVVATMLGAGKKDSSGTFSGVLMGTVGESESNGATGLYGISNGIVTYSLLDNGVATFKAQGEGGEVQLGNNTNTIKSKQEVKTTDAGLLIDIDDGIIHLGSGEGKIISGALEISKNNFSFSNSNITVKLTDAGLELSSTKGLTINSSVTIGAATINTDGSIKVGSTIINADGSITYNNQSLESYIKSLVDDKDSTT